MICAASTTSSSAAHRLFNFGPLAEKMRRLTDQAAIAAAGTRLRICMVDLATQSLTYCDERFELYRYATDQATGRIERENVGRLHEPWLGHAALASSSIPLVNPPYPVRREHVDAILHMLDGGVREVIPIGPAREILGETAPARPGERGGVIAIGAGVVNPAPGDFTFGELHGPLSSTRLRDRPGRGSPSLQPSGHARAKSRERAPFMGRAKPRSPQRRFSRRAVRIDRETEEREHRQADDQRADRHARCISPTHKTLVGEQSAIGCWHRLTTTASHLYGST
jgi:predicted acylesterase/phospholipase RssA